MLAKPPTSLSGTYQRHAVLQAPVGIVPEEEAQGDEGHCQDGEFPQRHVVGRAWPLAGSERELLDPG